MRGFSVKLFVHAQDVATAILSLLALAFATDPCLLYKELINPLLPL